LEMSRNQLYDKMVSSVSGIKFDKIKKGTLESDDWPKLSSAVTRMKDRKIHVLDRAGMHINQIAAASRRINRKEKLGLVVVDYLQLIRGDGNNRTEQVGSISRALKGLAKELDCPVLALSQLSRAVEQRPNKRPVNADLRDSGEIEQDADIIMFIYRDEVYNENSPEKGIAEIITTKFRNGEIGTDRLMTRLDCSRFENLAHGYEPPEEEYKPKKKFSYQG
jgi:replicative DNA helicase